MLAPCGASVFVIVFALLNNGRHSMWFDEAYSAYFANRDFNQLLHDLVTDEANMGPYYLLLWGWRQFSNSDVWLRSLSIVGTVAAVWLVWAVTSRWASRAAAAAAVCMLALNPFVLTWTVQARGYTLVIALTVLVIWLADLVRTTTLTRYAVALGVTAAVLVATNFATVFIVIAAAGCTLAFGDREKLVRPLGIGALVSSILFAPFGYAFLTNRSQVSWIPELTVQRFISSTNMALGGKFTSATLAIGLLVLLAMLARLREPRVRPVAVMLLVSIVTGVVGLVLVSIIVQPLFVNRYLIGILPIATIGAAIGFDAIRPPRWHVAALALLPLAALVGAIVRPSSTTQTNLEDYRSAARLIEASVTDGDAVIDVDGHTSVTLGRYLESPDSIIALVPTDDRANPYGLRGLVEEPSRVWLVLRGTSFTTSESATSRRSWITSLYPEVLKRWELDGVTLELRSHGRA